jgi:hypothetical protein
MTAGINRTLLTVLVVVVALLLLGGLATLLIQPGS